MGAMKHLILATALVLSAVPALAQQEEEPSGFGLIGEGAGQILQGLRQEAAPAIDGLADLGAGVLPTVTAIVHELGPGFFETFAAVDSIANYEAPEFLPNGDILVRREAGAPAWTPPETSPAP